MDAKDWAFLRKFCLIALAITVALSIVIMYSHNTAEPVTPSTSSQSSRVVSYNNGSTIELSNATTLQQQKAATARTSATNNSTVNGGSDDNGLFTFFLIVCALSGIGAYIIRGGKPIYLREPWQTF